MRITLLLILSVALILQTGCADKSRPADLPKLYPASISITQESKPLEGATVTLMGKTPSKYGSATGVTDASGAVIMMTYGYPGVPAGEYAVTVSKMVTEGANEVKNAEGYVMRQGGKTYGYVDKKFSEAKTTTLSLTVTNSEVAETFDVGAPVHDFLGNAP